jgi:hypothetical protein
MTFPEIWEKHCEELTAAGLQEEYAAKLSTAELQSIISALPRGKTTAKRGSKPSHRMLSRRREEYLGTHINGDLIESDAVEEALLASACDSRSEPNEPKPMRKLASDTEAAAAQGISLSELGESRRGLVSEMAVFNVFERSKYARQIRTAAEEVGPEPSQGITIGVLLVNGTRMVRRFAPEAPGSHLYLWCATDPKMMRAIVSPGTFVIVTAAGIGIRPSIALGEQIKDIRILLNVRLIV